MVGVEFSEKPILSGSFSYMRIGKEKGGKNLLASDFLEDQ